MSARWVRRPVGATALTVALILAAAACAAAKSRCARRTSDRLAPALIKPCAGARIRTGHNFTFQVRDRDPFARHTRFHPYLNLTQRRPRRGILPSDDDGYGIYAQMHPVAGHPGRFRYRAPRYHLPGYWLFHRGVWYVQVLQVDGTGRGQIHYGRVEKITIR
jgi:hypothetical protein